MISNVLLLAIVLIFGLNIGSVKGDDRTIDKKNNVENRILKLGYVDVNELMRTLPMAKKASKELTDFGQQLRKQFSVQQEELNKFAEDFQNTEKSLTKEQKNKKEMELAALYEKIHQFTQEMDYLAGKKHAELFQPVFSQINSVIQEISESEGYDFIFNKNVDGSMPILCYGKSAFDITKKVSSKLEKMSPPVETPVAVSPEKQPVVKATKVAPPVKKK